MTNYVMSVMSAKISDSLLLRVFPKHGKGSLDFPMVVPTIFSFVYR